MTQELVRQLPGFALILAVCLMALLVRMVFFVAERHARVTIRWRTVGRTQQADVLSFDNGYTSPGHSPDHDLTPLARSAISDGFYSGVVPNRGDSGRLPLETAARFSWQDRT